MLRHRAVLGPPFNWYGAVVLVLAEALFFAAAAAPHPGERGRALGFVGASTLAEALRLTWPFGALPLGGVFLGQADGPLVELARLGGPLGVTAGVSPGARPGPVTTSAGAGSVDGPARRAGCRPRRGSPRCGRRGRGGSRRGELPCARAGVALVQGGGPSAA